MNLGVHVYEREVQAIMDALEEDDPRLDYNT